MAVVINDFEVSEPQPAPAAAPAGGEKAAGDSSSPVKTVKEVGKAFRRQLEHSRRLWAH